MELYLDSADLKEIEEAFQLGFLNGLTTTPTFMHRGGVTDVDGLIVKLSKIVPVLQIEALGDTAEQVLAEAKRQLDLGLDIEKTEIMIKVINYLLLVIKHTQLVLPKMASLVILIIQLHRQVRIMIMILTEI